VFLHLYQPIESGLEEMGKARPNGGMIYLGADEVLKKKKNSLFLSNTRGALKTLEVARGK
jgi:hypothetical protein